jgi:hypothetical protein
MIRTMQITMVGRDTAVIHVGLCAAGAVIFILA